MTNKKLKLEIVGMFLKSALVCGIGTIVSFYVFFSAFYYLYRDNYYSFMNWFNQSYLAMMGFCMLVFLVFALTTFWVFMRKMNVIMNTISEITSSIKEIAEGNLEVVIPIRREDELGSLAKDINIMEKKWKNARDKEEEWHKERYQMITSLSHDLKTPMMSIMGYVNRLKTHRYQDEKEFYEYCDIVERKTRELNQSINQLFEWSKINATDFRVNKQILGMRAFLEQIVMTFIPDLEKEALTYHIDVPQKVVVYADPDLLKRICENIIGNAIKYASDGTYIKMVTEVKKEGLWIHFENDGKMIPKEEQEMIFEKFYRMKNNEIKEGNGCGLAIVKQMMRLQNGTVTVYSDERETRFSLFFPQI